MLAHNVYFLLKDRSEDAVKQMVDDSHRLLAPIPGVVFYAAGTRAPMERPVNDRHFDVALHVVFENQEGMEAYLTHPSHVEYVDLYQGNWAAVRVFDSVVASAGE